MGKNTDLEIIQGVFDTIPGFVSLFSRELKYLKVNKTLADACNLKKEDFVGKNLGFIDSESISEPDMKTVMDKFLSSDDQVRQLEFVITATNGIKTNTLTTIKKIDDGNEIVVISIDNTERKLEQDIILKQKDMLIKNSRFTSIGKASGEVAHEISSPLMVITTVANRLKKIESVSTPEEVAAHNDFADKILKQAGRIKAISDRLRRVSRTGDHDSFEVTPLIEIFDDAYEVVHDKLKNHHVEVGHNIDKVNISLECLRIPLSQVLINLFNNSCDAICKQEHRWIKLDAHQDGNKITLTLTDSGSGIPREVADKMFDNGFTTKKIGEGTGLGMSITKDIIEKHGGTISIDHDFVNTRFVITLPTEQKKEEPPT